jgi:hypothetical protein
VSQATGQGDERGNIPDISFLVDVSLGQVDQGAFDIRLFEPGQPGSGSVLISVVGKGGGN